MINLHSDTLACIIHFLPPRQLSNFASTCTRIALLAQQAGWKGNTELLGLTSQPLSSKKSLFRSVQRTDLKSMTLSFKCNHVRSLIQYATILKEIVANRCNKTDILGTIILQGVAKSSLTSTHCYKWEMQCEWSSAHSTPGNKNWTRIYLKGTLKKFIIKPLQERVRTYSNVNHDQKMIITNYNVPPHLSQRFLNIMTYIFK